MAPIAFPPLYEMKGYSLCVNTCTVHLSGCDRMKNLITEYETQLFCLCEPLRSLIIVNKCFFSFLLSWMGFTLKVLAWCFAHRVKHNLNFCSLFFSSRPFSWLVACLLLCIKLCFASKHGLGDVYVVECSNQSSKPGDNMSRLFTTLKYKSVKQRH